MPEGHLHAVVDAIAAAGSQQLARRAAEGAPVPFDLVEVPSAGTGAPLFSYRPRTRDFVEEHAGSLRQLMAWSTAVNVLAGFDGLGDYLLTHGERHVPIDARERADLVLRVLLARMHEETGDFLHTPQRSAAASAELARCLLAGRVEGTVVVPILGVRLDAERIVIEDGLELVRDDVLGDLPREARSPVRSRPGTVVLVRSLEDPARAAALAQARPRLRSLLTALRLYDQSAPALAPVAWSRMRGDGWASHPFVGTCARASGTLHIRDEDHEAIRGFCALMAGSAPTHGTPAWALRRFELACERADHGEALTDVLLGLRALLEADHVGSGVLADRLAALCAAHEEWDALRDRVQMAEALELGLMQGTSADPSRVRALALELRGHLRALLRDMACGHLPHDLVSLAEHHLIHDEHGHPLVELPQVEAAAHEDLSFEAHPVVVTDAREDDFDLDLGPLEAPEVPVEPSPAPHLEALPAPVVAEPRFAPAAPAPQLAPAVTPSAPVAPQPSPQPNHVEPQQHAAAPEASSTVALLQPLQPAEPAATARPTVVPPPVRADLVATAQPSRSAAAREVTATGESFEAAFIRSLSEGPSTLR